MGTRIRKVGVLGAGVMGSGIAAHLASCGFKTLLLDIVPPGLSEQDAKDPSNRNKFAAGGVAASLQGKPNPWLRKETSELLVEIGNFDDDMGRLAECDWVVEVVKEDMGIKRSLLAKVEAAVRPGTIVTSNTSGLSIAGMLEGRGATFKKHFLGTHFFNPVRYMHLLEIIEGPDSDPAVVAEMAHFVERYLGKGVVYAKDTPNFIANRIGVYSMLKTIQAMGELDYTIEEVDAIVGRPMGRPSSAAFRTADVVGLDTFAHVADNCWDSLTEDPEREVFKVPDFLRKMVAKRLLGGKTKAGFYKKTGKVIETIDLETLEYRDMLRADLAALKALKKVEDPGKRLKALIADDSRAGKFAWHVLSHSLAYAANIAWDIADDVVNIDRAMRWGFNWDQGPFEAWQACGVKEVADRMRADGITVPGWVDKAAAKGGFYVDEDATPKYFAPGKGLAAVPTIPGSLSLASLKRSNGVVEKNASGSIIDIGDGVACLEFHTKLNTVDPGTVDILNKACEITERDFEGLVLANEADHFSAGANLVLIVMQANQKKWGPIEEMVKGFQDANQRLKYLSKPVVSNPHGLTLGGGCEMALAADKMVIASECYMGLVEVGVGLIPGGGGTLNLLKKILSGVPASSGADRMPFVQKAFEAIGLAKVGTGAGEAFELGYANAFDEIAINRDRRIADAKDAVLYLAKRGYTPPLPANNLILPGKDGAAAISYVVYGMVLAGHASEHDRYISNKLGYVLCGGDTDGRKPVDEQYILDIEREAFMSLAGHPLSLARMQHMAMKNKPLRN